jgi:hypothetical protein
MAITPSTNIIFQTPLLRSGNTSAKDITGKPITIPFGSSVQFAMANYDANGDFDDSLNDLAVKVHVREADGSIGALIKETTTDLLTDAVADFADTVLPFTVPHSTVLTPDDEFSVSLWFKGQTSSNGFGDLYCQWDTNRRFVIMWREDLGTVETYWTNGTNATVGPLSSAAVVDTLYHVVVTYSSSGNLVQLVINDGTPVTSTGPTGLYATSPEDLSLGDRGQARLLTGYMQHVMIYSKVLTSGEITALYNGGVPVEHAILEDTLAGLTTSLDHFWHLNEGSGNRVDTVGSADFIDNQSTLYTNGSVAYPITPGAQITTGSTGTPVNYTNAAALFAGVEGGMGAAYSSLTIPTTSFSLSCWYYSTGSAYGVICAQWNLTDDCFILQQREDLAPDVAQLYWTYRRKWIAE